MKSPQWLRNIKTKKRPFWKFYKPKTPQLILDGGWHFSFLKKPKDIAKKLFLTLIKSLIKMNLLMKKKLKKELKINKIYLTEILNMRKLRLTAVFQNIFLIIKQCIKIG